MTEVHEPVDSKRIVQLAQRALSATSGKEFIAALEEAHLGLNWQEWSHFNAAYRRLEDEKAEKSYQERRTR